jgi:hypothetical protein
VHSSLLGAMLHVTHLECLACIGGVARHVCCRGCQAQGCLRLCDPDAVSAACTVTKVSGVPAVLLVHHDAFV